MRRSRKWRGRPHGHRKRHSRHVSILSGGDGLVSAMETITKHYIDGAFVECGGCEVMDSVNPTNGKVIGRIMLADEEDARRAIAAAKDAFPGFARTTKEERTKILRRLHEVVAARIDD